MLTDWKIQHGEISFLTKLTCKFNVMPIKILAEFLVDIEKLSLNFIEKDKGTRITEIALSKKNKVGGFLDLFAFKWQWTKQCGIDKEIIT